MDWYVHPMRARENAPGPFYAVAIGSDCGCGLPEEEAPTCSPRSVRRRIKRTSGVSRGRPTRSNEPARRSNVCPIHDLRYGGTDPAILRRLPEDQCDFRLLPDGRIELRRPAFG